MSRAGDPLTRAALVGSWILADAHVMRGDEIVDPAPFGADPKGILHYLPDGRMAVLIAHRERPPLLGGRQGASDADRLRAARTFVAYAGTFDVEPDRIVHHVDINDYPNDVAVDYPRLARLKGDRLELATLPELPVDQRPMRLRWRRYRG